MARKKLGFSLSGGGTRGIAHAGFLQAMEENGIVPDVISGCSMGAVVGGCYSAGVSTETMKTGFLRLTKKDLFDINFNILRSRSVFAGKKMKSLLSRYLGEQEIENLKIKYGCIATDLTSGKLVDLVDGDLVSAILASSAVPTVFAPVERNGSLLVDGGVLLRNPVKLAKKLGAEVIIGVDVLGSLKRAENCKKLMDVGMRTFSVIDNVYCAKLGTKTADLMIYPEIDDAEIFNFENLNVAYESGYKAGIDNAEEIKKLIK